MRARVARFTAISQALLLMATLILPALAAAAEIATDLWVYQYGDTVTVTGVDFGADEDVSVVTTDPYGALVDSGTGHTDSAGGFTYQFVLLSDVPGIYDVVATGQSSGYAAATQFDPPVSINTTTTLSASPSPATYGTAETLSGTLNWTNPAFLNQGNQTRAGRTIHLRVFASSSCSGGSTLLADRTTTAPDATSAGSYSFSYTPGAIGSVQASFDGFTVGSTSNTEDRYQGSTSACVAVGRANTTTTGSVSSSSIFDGESFTVGYSTGAIVGVAGNTAEGTVAVAKLSGPGGAGSLGCLPANVAVSQAQSAGGWSQSSLGAFTCTPTGGTGPYTLRVVFSDSDGNYNNSNSTTLSVTVQAQHTTSLTESLTPSTITYGEQTTASGTLTDTTDSTPIGFVNVTESERTTQNTSCGGSEITNLGTDETNGSGQYSLTFTPLAAGSFDIRARYAGDFAHAAASACATLTVGKAPTVTTAALADLSITTAESTTVSASVLSHYGISGNDAVGALSFAIYDSPTCDSGLIGAVGTAETVDVAQASADNNPTSEIGFSFDSAGVHTLSGLAAGDYGVRALFEDNNGQDGNYSDSSDCETLTVTSGNQAPTVDAGDADGAYSGNEGSAISLDGTASDPDAGDVLQFHWTVDYNAKRDAGASCSFADEYAIDTAVTCTDDSNDGYFILTLTVDDQHGHVVSDTATLTVANVAPTVTLSAGNTLSVTESNVTEHTYSYTRSDAGSNDVLTSHPDCGTYGTYVAASDNGSSFKCKFVDGGPTPPGTDTTVSIYVTDDETVSNTSTTASQVVNIANANPVVATPTWDSAIINCQTSATLTGLSFSDAGINDADWAFDIDWDDGNTTGLTRTAQGAVPDQSHLYTTPGTYSAAVDVTDKDGGVGSATSGVLTVLQTYTVNFLAPLDQSTPAQVIGNTFKNGRVLPVKVTIKDDCTGAWVTGSTGEYVTIRVNDATFMVSPGAIDSCETFSDAGASSGNTTAFRWVADLSVAGGGYWIYNLDSSGKGFGLKTGNTYQVRAVVNGIAVSTKYALLMPTK